MKRTQFLSFLVVCVGSASLLATNVQSQSGNPKNVVFLQGASPGISQSGHANISGNFIAGAFAGNGSALTNLNADNIATGTIGINRLPVNAALLIGAQTFTGVKTFSAAPAFTNASAPFSVTSSSLVANLNADKLDSLNSSDFMIRSVPNTSTGSSSTSMLLIENASSSSESTAISGIATSTTGNVWGVYGESRSNIGIGVLGYATSVTGFTTYGGFFVSEGSSGIGVLGVGKLLGVKGTSENVGGHGVEGTSNGTTGAGVFGSVGAGALGLQNAGGWFENLTGNGSALRAESSSTYGIFVNSQGAASGSYGVHSTIDCSGGRAISGVSLAGTGPGVAGHFTVSSNTGIGVLGSATNTTGPAIGGQFISASSAGTAVYGLATATTGPAIGGKFETSGSSGRAVSGTSNATAGVSYGGYFECASSTGRAVYGNATDTTGINYGGLFVTNSPLGVAVQGTTSGSTARAVYGTASAGLPTDTPYGVYGVTSVVTLGSAVHAQGDLTATGVKPFRIDHPQDPLNKYLFHYASESPFPQNFYNGNVTTDSKGYAWVELPDYFEDINTNIKYQLTIVDEGDSEEFVMAKVVTKVKNNRFRIRTNIPNVEVSWMVFADRNDARVQFKRPTDVRDKAGRERGKYQHPEYYGAPASMGVDYVDPKSESSRPR